MVRGVTPIPPCPGRRAVRASRSVRTVAALATLALVVAACGSDDDPSDGGSPDPTDAPPADTSTGSDAAGTGDAGGNGGEAVDGGDLTYAIDTTLSRLDPNTAAAAQDARMMRQIYDSLVALDDGVPVPWLATEWSVSDDGLEYTFTLRDDVVFHDGTALDAEAVCFNFDRIADPAAGSIFAIGAIGPFENCDAPDATTVVITLASPYAPFLANLSSPFLGIISPTGLEAAGSPENFSLNPVGSGPFAFGSYTTDDRLVLERYDAYAWPPANAEHEGPAHLDSITFQIIPDATVRLGSLRNSDVQAIGNVPETDAASLADDDDLGFYAQAQSGAPYQLFFNTERPPWSDPAVRVAVRSGLDLDTITDALFFGVYERAWTPLAPSTPGYDDSLEGSWDFDPDGAAAALDEAGWVEGDDGVRVKDGEPLSLILLDSSVNREKRQDIAVFVRDQLRGLGVDVEVDTVDTAALQERIMSGDYDLAGLSLVNVDPNVMYTQYHSRFVPTPEALSFNFGRVADPALDERLLAAQAEGDPDARAAAYAELQAEVLEAAYSVPVYVPTYTVGTNGLEGLRFDAEGYPILYDSWLAE